MSDPNLASKLDDELLSSSGHDEKWINQERDQNATDRFSQNKAAIIEEFFANSITEG